MKNVLVILLVFLFTSCGMLKNFEKSSSEVVKLEKSEVKKDSSNTTTINKAISDNVSLSLRTNNKVVDSIIKSRLKGFTSKKTSGKNSYRASFNYDKMVLDIATLIGETQNSSINTNTKEEKSYEERTDEYISKKVSRIPWWLYVVLAFWFSPQIISRLSVFDPILSRIFKK